MRSVQHEQIVRSINGWDGIGWGWGWDGMGWIDGWAIFSRHGVGKSPGGSLSEGGLRSLGRRGFAFG